jgi:hypothetical protein
MTMPDPLGDELDRLHAATRFKRLNPLWAKAEILLGLLAVGVGLLLGGWAVRATEVEFTAAGSGLALFILGGYLALAGHRSHLYQSNTRLTAYLAGQTRPGPPSSRS